MKVGLSQGRTTRIRSCSPSFVRAAEAVVALAFSKRFELMKEKNKWERMEKVMTVKTNIQLPVSSRSPTEA